MLGAKLDFRKWGVWQVGISDAWLSLAVLFTAHWHLSDGVKYLHSAWFSPLTLAGHSKSLWAQGKRETFPAGVQDRGSNGSPLPLLCLKRASLWEFMAAWPPASGLENLAASVLHKKGKCIHYYYIIIQCIIYNSDYTVSSQSLWPQIRGWGVINPPSEVFGGSMWRWEDSTPSITGAFSKEFLPQATLEVEFGGDWEDLDKQYLVYLGCDVKKVTIASSGPRNADGSQLCLCWRQRRSDPEAWKEQRGSLQLLGSDSLLKTWSSWVSLSASPLTSVSLSRLYPGPLPCLGSEDQSLAAWL